MTNLTAQQKFYLLDSTIVNLEKTMETLEITSTTGYAAFLAAIKAQRNTYYNTYSPTPNNN